MNQTALHIDCMEYMRGLPDKAFDLAIVDVEYNIGASKPTKKTNLAIQKNGNVLSVKSTPYTHKEWDCKKSPSEYFLELFRVSNRQIIWGGNYYGLQGGYLVWDKINGDSDQFGCELAWVSFNNRTDIVHFMWGGMMQGVYCGTDVRKASFQQGNKKLNETRIHPTQKPVALYKWLLQNYAKQGDKILDTHLGSGSSRIAAFDMGFEFVGCELDKEYFDMQEKRFAEHVIKNGNTMFKPNNLPKSEQIKLL